MITPVKKDPWLRNHLIRDGINAAIHLGMERDPSIYLFGEGAWVKQHYDAPNILRDFSSRVVTMPISEDGSINYCIGASLAGIKPVYDIITADFLYRAMDSIANTAAKLNFVRPNELPRTIVIRSEFMIGGPTTGQRPEALFAHIPGLNVVIPSTPRDAYGLMRTALNTPGVTLFFEDRMIQDDLIAEPDTRMNDPIGFGYCHFRIESGAPALTIITYGLMRQRVESVIDRKEIHVDLIDLRTIYPIDWLHIKHSVRHSKKLLIIEPDVQYGGVGAEIAAQIAESVPETRIKRLGARRETIPSAMQLHDGMLPSEQEILDAIHDF